FSTGRKWIRPGNRILLDLGKVGDIAVVKLNGMPVDTLWKPPYQADITGHLKIGENQLEIKVTNQWTNRLLGDQKAAADKRILNSKLFVFPGQSMNQSGLVGPVRVLRE
ncbi:MAG: hypothetical protein IQL11_05030, partial [Bacteroidales bacterium]|nr:hypothetical protein [Bacteroidales bacterium]